MSTDFSCPSDEVLLALKDGDTVPPEILSHVASCDACQRRVDDLNAAIRTIQDVESEMTLLEAQEGTIHGAQLSSIVTRAEDSVGPPPEAIKSIAESDEQPGRFQLIRLLGRGAFGEVHLAFDPHLDRKVAIKVAQRRAMSRTSKTDRFLREAQAAAQLRHPNIIPVYDVGQSDSLNYIVYEFVEGQTLRAVLLFRRRLEQVEGVKLVTKLARALHYAHAHGIVHRDIKPDNILIDQNGEPHIADFGLAYRDEAETLRTREGVLMGTPAYMSPEQASGRIHDVDARADIWSLGVLLQEVLTGERPFEGPLNSILSAIQRAEPRAITDEEVSKDLAVVCHTCLAKSAASRYQTADELADDLDRWIRGEPVTVRPIGIPARAWRWACRNSALAALISTVIVVLLCGAAISSYFAVKANRNAASLRSEQRERAIAQINSLRTAGPESVATILAGLQPYRAAVLPRLSAILQNDQPIGREQTRLRLGMVALGDAPTFENLSALVQDLTVADGAEFLMLREQLAPYSSQITDPLWMLALHDDSETPRARFRAECALAQFEPDAEHWPELAETLAAELLIGTPAEVEHWATVLKPISDKLLPSLVRTFDDGEDNEARSQAAHALATLLQDDSDQLVGLLLRADPIQLRPLVAKLPRHAGELPVRLSEALAPERGADERANAAIGLLSLGDADSVWPILAQQTDNSTRTAFVHRMGPAGIDPAVLVDGLSTSSDPFVTSALLQSLGEYRSDILDMSRKRQLLPRLLDLLRSHPDSGVHSATEWLLRSWHFAEELAEFSTSLQSRDARDGRQWYVNRQGQTVAVFPAPIVFLAGSPDDEVDRGPFEDQHEVRLAGGFAISTKEITNQEFRRFQAHAYQPSEEKFSPAPDCPVINVSWFDAARYCRWLSEQEEIPEDQMCFPPLGEIGPQMSLADIHLERSGYRLPTAAEWEYACRAGAMTSRHFGNNHHMLHHFGWYSANSQNRTWPVGSLKPNGFGLFDVHGNALEWCQNLFQSNALGETELVIEGDDANQQFELRGGTYLHPPSITRCAWRDFQVGSYRSYEFGFRVARTYNKEISPR